MLRFKYFLHLGLVFYTSNKHGGKSYGASTEKVNWLTARDICRVNNGTLAVVTTADLDQFLKDRIADELSVEYDCLSHYFS